ncbi:amino acid permease [Crenobacter sp. HX-7-9]|uniref:Amino acid permease n=2 Tax=Crenobacter caeni TaxID=2705474 RepID=A0A6B2KS57_9NEIS|nr:amino acid permease [Crenobacter caeni]
MMASQQGKLGTLALTGLVVGAIVGSGVFALPQNMAEGAGAGAILIAWAITFVGMFALTRIFQWLTLSRPDITDGVYGYARQGFGEYLGFSAAWGYWMSVWIGSTGYLVVMFSALGSFGALSFFGDGTTLPAMVGGLVVLALMHGFVLMGVRSAAILNTVVTIAKVVPIGLFIVCVGLAFRVETFNLDFWGSPELGSIADQVKTTMLYTVWVFLGIECATVYANRARDMATVSRATLLGFLITIGLFVCVSVLSLGVVPQEELAAMKNPSMAAVMARAVGPWGGALVNIGLILSVGGAFLAWSLISSEMLYLAARGDKHTAPALFGRLNANGTPANALWLTNGLIGCLLVINHFNEAGYNILIQLASSMALIPYFLCAAFGLKLALGAPSGRGGMLAVTALGTAYGLWLIYAGGMSYLLLSMILYVPALGFFWQARRERGLPVFAGAHEQVFAALVVLGACSALYMLAQGTFAL